ncbi:major facilitator superfamily domain-containing protein [Aspergillus filifer]
MNDTELVAVAPIEGEPTDGRQVEQQLAPVDGKSAAWRLLCAAFVFETLLWGFPLSFRRFQRRRRQIILVGFLILTQGVAYGLGFLIFYYPILTMVNEYWIARRGMAYGVLYGASGFLGSYGYRTILRAVAVTLFILTGPSIPLLKGRLPPSERAKSPEPTGPSSLNPLFWVYSVANILQGFGYFFPSFKSGALLLALMSISQVLGQFAFGLLSDRKISLPLLPCLSTITSAIATLTMWRLASSLPPLIVFAIVYGFFGAGFTVIWARMSTAITDDAISSPIVFALLNFGKGVGNVLAGPIGGALVSANSHGDSEGSGSAAYRWVIVFTGVCMLESACAVCSKYLGVVVASLR